MGYSVNDLVLDALAKNFAQHSLVLVGQKLIERGNLWYGINFTHACRCRLLFRLIFLHCEESKHYELEEGLIVYAQLQGLLLRARAFVLPSTLLHLAK